MHWVVVVCKKQRLRGTTNLCVLRRFWSNTATFLLELIADVYRIGRLEGKNNRQGGIVTGSWKILSGLYIPFHANILVNSIGISKIVYSATVLGIKIDCTVKTGSWSFKSISKEEKKKFKRQVLLQVDEKKSYTWDTIETCLKLYVCYGSGLSQIS